MGQWGNRDVRQWGREDTGQWSSKATGCGVLDQLGSVAVKQ